MTERLRSDERGVSEVIGAILVFAVLVALLAIMQAEAVPNQNQQVEFEHSLDVQSDLVQFHQTASAVAADGSERSVAFETGTGYPPRLLFFNPPRVRGTLETTDPEDVVIDEVKASDGEVNDYIAEGSPSASQGNRLRLSTRRLVYQVDYNEIQNDPTTRYEYGILYDRFDDGGTVVENQGTLIDGTDINLLFLEGDSSITSTTEQSLPVQPVSAPARSVTVTPTVDPSTGNLQPITLELPTELSEQNWTELYGSATNVQSISKPPGSDTVTITLDPGTTSNPKQYNLRMSKVAVESNIDEPDAHYIVPVSPGVTSAGVGQTAAIEYEVRDEFNNPVSGAQVQVPTQGGGTTTKTTDDRGRVSTTVTTSSNTDFTAELTGQSATNANCGAPLSSRCKADYRVQVPGLNLNPSSGVVVEDAQTGDVVTSVPTGLLEDNLIRVELENTGSQDVSIEALRINHYSPDPNSRSPVTLQGPGGNQVTGIEIGGEFQTASNSNIDQISSIGAGNTEAFDFQFSDSTAEGHYFVMTVIYSNNERALYFVSPEGSPSGPGGGGPPVP